MTEPKVPIATISLVDDYCNLYSDLFPEVRTFENFKYLHVGMISDIKRKSLPAISRVVGLHDAQPLQNFLTESPWQVKDLRQRRLDLTSDWLAGRPFKLVIDDSGDRKKGNHTDYVARQYIGNIGKVENGIVSVNAYGVIEDVTFPLLFKIFKPRSTLKSGDKYKTKPELAVEIIKEVLALNFKIELVLADSIYGESPTFVEALNQLKLSYILSVKSNHVDWLKSNEGVTYGEWQKISRIFTNGEIERRYIQEIKVGIQPVTYWRLTTDTEKLPANKTRYLMTNIRGNIEPMLGNKYGFRNWIEYAYKQAKNELGWADFRVTDYKQIEKWWEIVMSAYFMVSQQTLYRLPNTAPEESLKAEELEVPEPANYKQHKWWDFEINWKSTLKNIRLITQAFILFNLIKPWLKVFDIPSLREGFLELIEILNDFRGYIPIDSG